MKKAQIITLRNLILAGITIAAVLFLLNNYAFGPAKETLSKQKIRIEIASCEAQGKAERAKGIDDPDGDKRAPCCDRCPTRNDDDKVKNPDKDGDGSSVGCLGNDGNLPYNNDGTFNMELYIANRLKDKETLKKFPIETVENDDNPKIKPIYTPAECPS